ncbi:MAG: hypothetical protein AAF490_14315 [Chloroflexota bacterium]
MNTNAHIINHTHWDREWFLSSIYTTQWIPTLVDKLVQLAEANPDFRYFLDGQTLIIEDLLKYDPSYEERVRSLIENGNLSIGPYYCQPDWQLTCGELHLRNLEFGAKDMETFGGRVDAGWLVDTFGHIAQAPQIHKMFGLDSVYVWRGVPQLEPYFEWVGSDHTAVKAIDLFGGYRNLYGVSHAPNVAVRRLTSEVEKLSPYYPTPDIPLFDGYDLEDNPEDPLRFYEGYEIPESVNLIEATPSSFIKDVWPKLNGIPSIHGELNSGKFGATFPGTFSSRNYLKLLAYDCASLLYRRVEPLAAMASRAKRPFPVQKIEKWSRLLLQNAVHDCICGVSIDLVHEKMEDIYRRVFDECTAEIQDSLSYFMGSFKAGTYAVSSNPIPFHGVIFDQKQVHTVNTSGVGVWEVEQSQPIMATMETVNTFSRGDILVREDGTVQWQDAVLGRLVVIEDHGDTYSDEPGSLLGTVEKQTPLLLFASSLTHDDLTFEASFKNDEISVSATVNIRLADDALPRWTIDLDSTGVNFRVDFVCETAVSGQIFAGMPFDTIERIAADSDLLPRNLEGTDAKIFMGQRELNEVRFFPFHEHVGISNGQKTVAIFARGGNAYQADEQGALRICLRRSSEWLAKSGLNNRIGDAGPFFYVPDARCERKTTLELGVSIGNTAVNSPAFQAINQQFHNPPMIVTSQGTGAASSWQLLQEDVPLSSLNVQDNSLILRTFNPTNQPITLSKPFKTVDPFGNLCGETVTLKPKKIMSLVVPAVETAVGQPTTIEWKNAPQWRVGKNQSRPHETALLLLQEKVAELEVEIKQIAAQLADCPDDYLLQWKTFAYQRERLEYLLSIHLAKLKIQNGDTVPHSYLYEPDPTIVEVGAQLNQLRIKRRIFDYVVAAL